MSRNNADQKEEEQVKSLVDRVMLGVTAKKLNMDIKDNLTDVISLCNVALEPEAEVPDELGRKVHARMKVKIKMWRKQQEIREQAGLIRAQDEAKDKELKDM